MKNRKFMFLPVVLGIVSVVFAAEARVTLLPDYINANPFKNRINEHTAKKYQTLCENYAGVTKAYAESHGLVCDSVFSPAPNLVCYRDCGCDISYRYTSSNCRADEGRQLGGGICNGLYQQCNCDTTVYTYEENDSRCPSKNFSGICKGSNGTFYSSCNDPCEGLTAANCVVGGVDLGCAETYGNGCDLCKSCNNNTCNLPENVNKPNIATECNGCTTPVPGCSTKCESGCGTCEANCSGYRYDSPSAISYVNETYECVLCGGSTKYKAKSCVSGYKVDSSTGGCVPMSCDEHLRNDGFTVVENPSQFRNAVPPRRKIVVSKDIRVDDYTPTLYKNVYDYQKMRELGYTSCPNTSARLYLKGAILAQETEIQEVYPALTLATGTLTVRGNSQLYGGIGQVKDIIVENTGSKISLLGAKTYGTEKISGAGTIIVGPASTLSVTQSSTPKIEVSKLKLQIGGCVKQGTYRVCGGTSEAEIIFSSSPAYLPSRCSTGGWTNGKVSCEGNIYTNCSVGSTPVDMRYDPDRNNVCMITANTWVATPVSSLDAQENYSLLSSIPEADRELYCVRCTAMDGCDAEATTCYQNAENLFPSCFKTNKNPSHCMGTVVKEAKDACDADHQHCRGSDSCGVQWAEGKTDTVIVKNSADLLAAVAQSNISTVVVEGDIELSGPLNVPAGKTLLGAAGGTVGCACNPEIGDCSSGKYRILVNSDATDSTTGTRKLTVSGGSTMRDIAIVTLYRTAINPNTASVYVNSATDVIFDNAYVEGNEGYGIQDVSGSGSGIRLSGETQINGTTAIRGRNISSANTGTKLTIGADAQVVVTGYDKGIDGIEKLKMTAGTGIFTKLRVNARTLGISLYNTDGAATSYAYTDFALEGGKALVFKNMSGVNPVWPYNTKMRLEGNAVGIFAEGNHTLKITGDFDFKNTATASSTKAVESEGSVTIRNEGITGEGIVRMDAYTTNPLIDVKYIFEADSYLQLSNRSSNGIGIRAAHVTFGAPLCYKPMGEYDCAGFFAKSANISAKTGIEIVSGTDSQKGLLTFKSGADISLAAEVIPTATAIKLNNNTGMNVENGSAVAIEMSRGVVSAADSVISNIDGDFSVNSATKAFSGGSQNITGVLTAGSKAVFADGAAASVALGGSLQLNSKTVNIADSTSSLIMPDNALIGVNFEEDTEGGGSSVDRDTLFNNGSYRLSGTLLESFVDGESMLYEARSSCASGGTTCSMSEFKLGDYIVALGSSSGHESDGYGNTLTKLTTCPAFYTRNSCNLTTGTNMLVCPYDNSKMKCYGVINSNRSLTVVEGQSVYLNYFGS